MKSFTTATTTLCLFLSLSASHANDDTDAVTCGSAIKLTHVESGNQFQLNSENQKLGTGSGQQLVTLVQQKSSTSSLWWVREGNNDPLCDTASPIACGSTIRLVHLDTMKNLHTHNIPSPLSRQQEVTAFGQNGQGDTGDDWTVVCSTKYWKRNEPIRLLHVDTKKYLSASSQVQFNQQNCGGNCPIMNHLEAFARKSLDDYSLFKVELGVHISK